MRANVAVWQLPGQVGLSPLALLPPLALEFEHALALRPDAALVIFPRSPLAYGEVSLFLYVGLRFVCA